MYLLSKFQAVFSGQPAGQLLEPVGHLRQNGQHHPAAGVAVEGEDVLHAREERLVAGFIQCRGASYAVHEDAHIRITALIGKLSGGRRRGMDLVVLTLWLLFALWLTVEGCVLVGKIAAMGQVSSAMRIPMTIPYASVPIGGALMTIRLVQKIVERLRNTQEEEA